MLTREPEVRSNIGSNTATTMDRCTGTDSLRGQLILLVIFGLVVLLRWLR